MQWTYNGKKITKIPDEYEGFVYLITNKTTGQKYIGKKLAKFKTTKPPLKGKKNKRRGYKESDWKTYYGSQTDIKQLLVKGKKDEFERTILKCVETKKQLTYFEIKYQMLYQVLEKPDEFFNDNILGKFFTKDLNGIVFEDLVDTTI